MRESEEVQKESSCVAMSTRTRQIVISNYYYYYPSTSNVYNAVINNNNPSVPCEHCCSRCNRDCVFCIFLCPILSLTRSATLVTTITVDTNRVRHLLPTFTKFINFHDFLFFPFFFHPILFIERGTVRNSKSHRNNHRDNKWQRQNSKLMKHHKLSFGNHNDNGADSDGGDGGRRYNKHKAKSRSGYQHHASVIGSGHGHSMTSSASRSIYNSKFKSNPPYIQAHINFFDTSTGDDSLKSNKYETTGIRQSKWPNLSRLQTQLHQEIIEDSLPPYIKKFNRRNKQLINLLEGTVSPNYIQHANRKAAHQQRRQKQRNKWLEENLFEQQRRPAAVTPALPDLLPPVAIISATTTATTTKAKAGTTAAPSSTVHGSNDKTYKYIDKMSNFLLSRNVQSEPNALPGEHLSLSSEEDVDIDSERDERGQFGIAHKREHQQVYPISPKADTFLFHRVAASPKLVGTGLSGNGVAKPRLPFVAITDRRVGEAPQRRIVQPSRNNMSMP